MLFLFSAVGALFPFIPLHFMLVLKLSIEETGILYCVMPFVGFLMRPVIGAIADKLKRHKAVLCIMTMLAGLEFTFSYIYVYIKITFCMSICLKKRSNL